VEDVGQWVGLFPPLGEISLHVALGALSIASLPLEESAVGVAGSRLTGRCRGGKDIERVGVTDLLET